MSEVKRYYIGAYSGEAEARTCSPNKLEIIHQDEGRYFVLDEDFDRVTDERDALQQRLTAADERADVLEGLLREAMPALDLAASAFKSAMPVRSKVRAALKPAEGGGDE